MRLGFALPQFGALGVPEAIVTVAKSAEYLGFDSLWVADRILWPVKPRVPYPTVDGALPLIYKRPLDPLEMLTFAAAHTRRIALGTSVINLPWYNPVLLARRLSTLDVLSAGRLRVGLGIGWSPDEYEAAGVPWHERGQRADESLQLLKQIWANDPVEFRGKYYRVPKSFIGPKPIQKPHPPIYMAAYTPAAMRRVATEAQGWFPAGIPLNEIGPMFESIKAMGGEAGRDPAALELIIRANVKISDAAIQKDRVDFSGSLEQIAEDLAAARRLGAAEILIDVQFSPGIDSAEAMVARMEQFREIARRS